VIATVVLGAGLTCAAPASAQTCYVWGNTWIETQENGPTVIVGGSETGLWGNTEPAVPHLAVTCSTTGTRTVVKWLSAPLYDYNNYTDVEEGYCASTAFNGYFNDDWVEALGGDGDNSLYGWHTIKAYYYSFTGIPQNDVKHGPHFSVQDQKYFGSEPPSDPCSGQWVWDETMQQYICVSPIVIATGNAVKYKLTSVQEGVNFDIDGDGTIDRVAWTEPDSDVAFLAYDANGDGVINSGKELFGSVTVPGKTNGFEALTALAGHASGLVDAANPFFVKLLLWTDRNHNGVSESSELRPFGDLFDGIFLGYMGNNRRDANGNLYKYRGTVLVKSGKRVADYLPQDYTTHTRIIYDVYLVVQR